MNHQPIESLDDPRLSHYTALTEAQLRRRLAPEQGVMIVESPKVILTALNAGHLPLSLLCEERHLEGDAASLLPKLGEVPVFTGSRQLLNRLTGYTLTRGVLCAMKRPVSPRAEDICRDARRIAVIAGVCDTTNIGSIFRSAAALGLDAVMLTRDSCDPLNRRSIRVSMGTVFQIPWTWIDDPAELKEYGFTTVAMALAENSESLDDPELGAIDRLAIILGTEGDGLPAKTIREADRTVMIPMYHGVDSLNVGAAAAVAFWQLRPKKEVSD